MLDGRFGLGGGVHSGRRGVEAVAVGHGGVFIVVQLGGVGEGSVVVRGLAFLGRFEVGPVGRRSVKGGTKVFQ